jgi:anion-transporting  ArsA/GET3 family ATPase
MSSIDSHTLKSSKDEFDSMENTVDISLKKRKKRSMDSLEKSPKIRKISDNHNIFTNKDNKTFQEIETKVKVFNDKESSQKTFNNSLLSNTELTLKNKCASLSDDSGNIENISNSQATDTLEGLDDLFEEEWSYKKDTVEDLDDLFKDEWCYENENTIDFSTPKRCIIIDIISETNNTTLSVKSNCNEISAIVKCFGVW